jgi:hypothetical protein
MNLTTHPTQPQSTTNPTLKPVFWEARPPNPTYTLGYRRGHVSELQAVAESKGWQLVARCEEQSVSGRTDQVNGTGRGDQQGPCP